MVRAVVAFGDANALFAVADSVINFAWITALPVSFLTSVKASTFLSAPTKSLF
jgi:hypothetical protein